MNSEELELLGDSKYRNYIAAVDKALKNFEYSSEWADLISALGKLNKVLQNNAKYQVIPKKLTIGKRLAQCLHPALPSGVHRKALETYEIIFKIIGPKRLARDLFLYSSGLFPLLSNASMSVKPVLLGLYETFYLPLGKTLKPGLQGLLTGVLPGLEEGSDYHDRTNTLLEKVAAAVEQSVFYSALWGSILTSASVRLPGISFVLLHLNRKLSMEDQLYVMGSDIELMVEAVSTSVQDSSVLVQRSTLDLILFCFPFHMSQATRPDMIRILSAALHVVLRRDMSLNRRLYAWLLGPRNNRLSNTEEHATHYFNTYSKDMLVQAMVGILQGKARGGEEESALMHDLKPFRILISLLDKPELGPVILEDVLIEVFRTLHTQCRAELDLQNQNQFSKDQTQLSSKLRENKKTAELIKTANLLFNSFEPYYMWDYIARWFEESCRRAGRGPGPPALSLLEFCTLIDFLLDIVSLPTRSMRVICQETYIEIQTEHLPQLLLRMISALTLHLPSLSLSELIHCLRLCSKILSKVQPPLVSPLTLPSTSSSAPRDQEPCCPTVPVSLTVDAPLSEEVFEEGDALPTLRSPESSFTDFVQYEGQGEVEGEDSARVRPAPKPCSGSGVPPKLQGAPLMQRCLEHFQHFLCSLVDLHVTPGLREGGALQETTGVTDQKECVAAFGAACQLFLECSSFPVYIAEGNLKSPTRDEQKEGVSVSPPSWLQALMNACFSELDFSVRAVAVALLMDLVGLTQSVAMVTAERVGGADSARPMSPSQGRVAVVIRPPLTQGMLRHIAENTDFFKRVAVLLWDQLGVATPQHHQRSVELFYQLHNLVPSSSICEDVISNQLMHRDKGTRLEAHVKFSVLWHLTRDLNISKSSPFSRTFDRSLFIMLDSLSYWDGSSSAVGRAWLNQVLQRHDIARVLEPLLLLLLHPKTHRVSIQRVQAQRHWTSAFLDPAGTEAGGDPPELGSHNYCISVDPSKARDLPLDDMEPLSLTVNPLSDSVSLLSLSMENLQLCGEYQPPDQQGQPLSSESTGSIGSIDELEASGSSTNTCDPSVIPAEESEEDSMNVVVSAIISELVDKVVQTLEDGSTGTDSPPEAWTRSDSDSSNSSETSVEPQVNVTPFSSNQGRTLPELVAGGTLELLAVPHAGEEPQEGITRHSSSPSIATLTDGGVNGSLHPDDPLSRKRSQSSTQLSLRGKIMERLADKSPGAKPKVKKSKRKDQERRKTNQADKNRPPSIFFGDSLDLENWYSCGEGEVSEIESDVGSPGSGTPGVPGSSRSSSRFNIHPLYQHVLLYLQIYDSSRALHALSAIAAMLRTAPAGLVGAISTTSINNTYTPQLSLLQNLLARHRVSVMGKDFYCAIPQDSHSFRSAMYLEIIISLCLYFLRSYYSAHVPAMPQDLAGNRAMQLTSLEVLTLLFAELAKVTGGSAKGFASFISDVLSKCKVQKVALHCLLSSIFSAQKWHEQRLRGTNLPAVEEGLSEDSVIDLSEDRLDSCSGVQSQLLRLLQSLVVLEHHVLVPGDDSAETGSGTGSSGGGAGAGPGGFEILGGEVEHVNPQQPMASLQYLHGQPITAQGMFLCAVIRALHQNHTCNMHPQWIGLVTATLPYMGRVLRRVVASVTLQLCRNLDNLIQQYRYETGITESRPQWMALCIPPDLILTMLEGVTAIIHYCLLDPSSQYHQLQVSVDQKHLAEARSGILSILHTIMSSVTLLWSALYLADTSERPSGATYSSNINLGSTKNLRQQILELLGPISMNHGAHFMAAIAYVWNERKQMKSPARNKVIPAASEEQLLLVDLVRSVNAMRTETVMQTVKEVLKQPPAIAKEKKHLSLEVCMLQFFYAYVQRIPVSSLVDSWASLLSLLKESVQLGLPAPGQFLILGVLNEFILKNPTLDSKKDQRELQDVTHKIVEAIGTIAGSSLEQTTWLRRNLEVKPSPQIVVDGASLETGDTEDLMLTVMEASSFTPSVYSVHALTLLAEVLAHLLDMVFYSDEKERVIPLLVNIMHYVVPYLRNHSAHNAPSYRACIQLLSSLSGYQYTRRAWKKEAFDLFMDHTFFQMDASCVSHWRAIIDHLMTHDKTTFRDLMTRVAVAQSSSLNLFTNRDAELEQRAMLLKRLAFTIYSSEVDQYQKYLPDIQERLVESLRIPQVPILHTQVFLFFRVLLLRMSPQHLTSLWPTMITELVQVFLLMEQELIADEDITRTSGPSVAGLETTYSGGNGFSTSYNSQRWLNLYLSACKLLDLALALPPDSLPQFQMYRWAFIPESSDDSGLEVRRQGTHQREFKPYVVRLAKLLRKRVKKSGEDDVSGRALAWEPGRLTLTLFGIRSMEQLLPFFTVLSQVFSSKSGSRTASFHPAPPADAAGALKNIKPESQRSFWSRARHDIEETVEKDFLEGLIKT
ncbi:protein dopey-1 isoform X2 [Trichomycterus rosablanca]|uniref:protein dopey-1 isoform X2 n=1 Tax=Trichomycterus rosablanca TaxID=2290929 RepID=UPI002F3527AD